MPPTIEISRDHDDEWLSAWVRRRDHAAFRALVGKYTGIVHGTALRKLGRADWAEEITQEVFILFARRAAVLRGAGGLASWLHRAAAFRSAARLRAEIRHRGRMKKLEAMDPEAGGWSPELSGAVPERDWTLLRPLVDEAVASLPERDRRVILLHYFEQKSYPEVAALTGDSHEAARKRGLRALDKLSRLLRRRGAALPVTAVGGGLSIAFRGTSPAALIPLASRAASAGIAAATLTGAGSFSSGLSIVSAFLSMQLSTPVIAAAVVLVIAAGSSAVWWSRSHREAGAFPVAAGTGAAAGISPRAPLPPLAGAKPADPGPIAVTPNPNPLPPASPPGEVALRRDPAQLERLLRDPRTKKAGFRLKALTSGFLQLMNGRQQIVNVKFRQIDEASRRSVDPSLSPEDQAAALAKVGTLQGEMKVISEGIEAYKADTEVWLRSEGLISRDEIWDQIAKEGGVDAPLPPPEPPSPEAEEFPAYRAAKDLMKGEQYGEALTAFTDLAKSSTGKTRDQAYWNALLCGLITGNAAAVESASLPLLRSTPSSACFAMAAKAIQQDEWGSASVWVEVAHRFPLSVDDPTYPAQMDSNENNTFMGPLRSLGWAASEGWSLLPPGSGRTGK